MSMTASEMAKRRVASQSPHRRREIAQKAGRASGAKARQAAHQRQLWTNILGAVETLMTRIKDDGKQRALLVHMGEVLVLTTDCGDYKKLVAKHPISLIGVYNHRTTRSQVFDDVYASEQLALVRPENGQKRAKIA